MIKTQRSTIVKINEKIGVLYDYVMYKFETSLEKRVWSQVWREVEMKDKFIHSCICKARFI